MRTGTITRGEFIEGHHVRAQIPSRATRAVNVARLLPLAASRFVPGSDHSAWLLLIMAPKDNREVKDVRSKCRLAEIVQYKCDLDVGQEGEPQVHCWPVPRIFRMCVSRTIPCVHQSISLGNIAAREGRPWN